MRFALGVAFAVGLALVACEPPLDVHPLAPSTGNGGYGGATVGHGAGAFGSGAYPTSSGAGGACASKGFATSDDFALPAGYTGAPNGAPAFSDVVGALSCAGGANVPAYTLADMNGDAKPDLVVTQACSDATVGASAWRVYENTGTGFATSASAWSLPGGYAGTTPPFANAAGALACTGGANVPTFSLVDMNGDAKLDLLVTRACGNAAIGASTWSLYANTGTGFAGSATAFALPGGYAGTSPPFPDVVGALACTGGANAPAYTLVDMDGDGKPDLLVTRVCGNATVGTTTWWMYKNTGAGFATMTPWPLPTGYTASSPVFGMIQGSLACTGGANAPRFLLADMNGDGKLDLLVTRTCTDATVGASKWLVYENTGSGFSANATALALPPGYVGPSNGAPAFGDVAGALSCASGANVPAFVVADMDADGKPDILVTQRCDDPSVGASTWLLYPNAGAGFATTPTVVTLPAGYGSSSDANPFAAVTGTLACTGGADAPAFTLFDLNGDGQPDVVLTRRCNDVETGASRWLLAPATCL